MAGISGYISSARLEHIDIVGLSKNGKTGKYTEKYVNLFLTLSAKMKLFRLLEEKPCDPKCKTRAFIRPCRQKKKLKRTHT